ncbi:MAG: ATP-binding protein [Prevotella sp.]
MEQLSKITPMKVAQSEQQFWDIVTKSYLHELSKYEVVPHLIKDEKPSTENRQRFRWIKINEIVYNMEEFFVDKFSMLFVALYNIASQVAVYIKRDKDATVHFYFGVRDMNNYTNDQSKLTLISGLRGYFPGISFIEEAPDDIAFEIEEEKEKEENPQFKNDISVAAVSGIATLKDDKNENFIQGIERLLNSVQEEMSVLIIADRVDAAKVLESKLAYETLYSNLSPLAERQLSCHNDYSKSVSETITKNFSLSTTKTIGKTITSGVNTSQNSQQGESCGENTGIGLILSLQDNRGSNTSIGSQIGHHRDVADVLSDAVQKTEGNSKAKSSQETTTTGTSIQVTFSNRKIKGLLDLLDKHISRIEESLPFGMWACSTYFIGKSETRIKAQANVYVGSIVGEQSNLETCVVNVWKNPSIVDYLRDISHPFFKYPESDILLTPASTVDSKELSIHISLPQTSVPGIIVREKTAFGRNVIKSDNEVSSEENGIKLGNVCFLGQESKIPVSLDVNTLCKHTFISGTTGSGKSNTIYLIIQELLKKGKKLLIIEPAKGEYKNIFGKGFWFSQCTNGEKEEIHVPIKVYGSDPRVSHLLRINPFTFPEGVHVYEHIDRLVEIFNACWPMYAAMPVVLKKAITDAYISCGWNLYESKCNIGNIGNNVILYPTFDDVVIALRTYINDSEYSSDTKSDYKGSIETRLLSLTEGLSGEMLNKPLDSTLQDCDLFEDNVIIDLSTIGNSETKSLIMGLLVMKMSEYYQSQNNMNSELKHVTILEEAHNLLKRTSKEQFQEGSNITRKSVEMITNSIAEMRTYGEGFIIVDQSPSMVDEAAIRNTNTKIIMSLPEVGDRTIAGKSIGLSDKQIEEISRQKVRQAIVFQNNWEEPVQCMICDFNSSHNDCRIESCVFKDPERLLDINYNDNARIIIKYLYNYTHKEQKFDCERIDLQKAIINSRYSSNLKYSLLKHANKDLASNQDELDGLEHVQIMELVAHCIGKIKNISKIISNKDNIDDINNTLRICIQDEFPNESEDFYLFCIRCSFRLQASLSTSAIEKYNNWFNKYC